MTEVAMDRVRRGAVSTEGRDWNDGGFVTNHYYNPCGKKFQMLLAVLRKNPLIFHGALLTMRSPLAGVRLSRHSPLAGVSF
jgi:hypothetical protein